MKYVMSWTISPTFHNDLPFILLHYTYAPFTSWPQFSSLHFASMHFWMISSTPSLRLIYHFLTIFLKLLGLQERVPKASAGSRAGWSYLQRNIFRYFRRGLPYKGVWALVYLRNMLQMSGYVGPFVTVFWKSSGHSLFLMNILSWNNSQRITSEIMKQ
jgi:hypothetical protein